jgi:hypothetical protein
MNHEKCKICGFDFKPGTTVEGKCTECVKKFPGVDSMEEWREKHNPELKKNDKIMEERVAKIVERKLKEKGVLVDCECGKSFFKKSPAQKKCGNCPKKEGD